MVTLAPVHPDAQDVPVVADDRRWPQAQAGRSAWPGSALAMLLVAGLYSLLYLRNHRYFFIDDAITGEIPNRMDIGRLLLSGQMPWLSTDFVNAGSHAIEYSHGIYNPLNLLLCMVLAKTQDAAFGSYLFVLVHALLLTAAAGWLAHLVGLARGWAVAVAVSVGFQMHTVVWDAAAWHEGVMSFAWLVLAVAAAVAFHLNPRRRYGWAVLGATYGCLTSGWPLAIPVLGLFALVLVAARLAHRQDLRQTAWLAGWFAGGLACSLVAVYPLLTASAVGARNSSISNLANFLVVPLDGLLQFADPGYHGWFNNFGGYARQPLPHFYVAWFVLPVLVLWKPRRFPPHIAVLVHTTAVMLLVSVMGALGPERLLVFRFPTRFLQYVGLFLVLLTALLVAHGRFDFSRRRVVVALGLFALLLLDALQADPAALQRVLGLGVLVAALVVLTWRAGRPDERVGSLRTNSAISSTVLVGGTTLVLAGLAVLHPVGRGVDWGFPHDLSSQHALSLRDYTMYYGDDIPADGYDEYRPSMIGVMVGDRQVNGYTSLGNRFFRRYFPMNDRGDFSLGAAAAFSQTDPGSGLQMLELLRVDQLITRLGPLDEELRAAVGDRWAPAGTGRYTATYRHAPYTLPGLLSYASPGTSVKAAGGRGCRGKASRECLRVTTTDSPGRLVFARLWFPGYSATLDGKSIAVDRYDDMLVSVQVPAGRAADVVVRYRSPGFAGLTSLAVLTLVVLALASARLPLSARALREPASSLRDDGAGQATSARNSS